MSRNSHTIIDGNNILHKPCSLWENMDFDSARWRLAREAERMLGVFSERITIVFDGTRGGRADNIPGGDFEVIFSDMDTGADALIERMVLEAAAPDEILAVTSDRLEREAVRAAGAEVMSCEIFIDLLLDQSIRPDTRNQKTSAATGPKLGDFFPVS